MGERGGAPSPVAIARGRNRTFAFGMSNRCSAVELRGLLESAGIEPAYLPCESSVLPFDDDPECRPLGSNEVLPVFSGFPAGRFDPQS